MGVGLNLAARRDARYFLRTLPFQGRKIHTCSAYAAYRHRPPKKMGAIGAQEVLMKVDEG